MLNQLLALRLRLPDDAADALLALLQRHAGPCAGSLKYGTLLLTAATKYSAEVCITFLVFTRGRGCCLELCMCSCAAFGPQQVAAVANEWHWYELVLLRVYASRKPDECASIWGN